MKYIVLILYTLVLTACGGGGGGSTSTAITTPSAPVSSLFQVSTYQNADLTNQIFNTAVADLNGDGLEDVVVSGWANEPASYTNAIHGKVPVRILLQQTDGTLKDQTDSLLGVGNNMIYGSQRIIIADFDGDGKLDIFLGGFQDSPALSHALSANTTTSVMFWNNGATFARYDFPDLVWAHAVCIGNINGTGLPSIVMGAQSGFSSNIYINNGSRNFTWTHTAQWIASGGQCSVIRDNNTGHVAIISGETDYNQLAGYDGVIQVFDSNLNFISIAGLPGSEDPNNYNPHVHDIVNIINMDLNNDGLMDLVLTDNNTGNHNGSFTALINQGNFVFVNQTSTYFPTQTNNYYFQYYTHGLNINGNSAIFVDNVDSNWNFGTLPDLWVLSNGSFQPGMQTQLSLDIGSYVQPTLYKDSGGNLHLMLIQNNNNLFTFYTKPLWCNYHPDVN